jgi:hypothetical protein
VSAHFAASIVLAATSTTASLALAEFATTHCNWLGSSPTGIMAWHMLRSPPSSTAAGAQKFAVYAPLPAPEISPAWYDSIICFALSWWTPNVGSREGQSHEQNGASDVTLAATTTFNSENGNSNGNPEPVASEKVDTLLSSNTVKERNNQKSDIQVSGG